MPLQLKVIEGQRKGEIFAVGRPAIIGRHSDADISILDAKMSGQHARLSQDNEGILIVEDLNSSNGTYVNEARVKNSALVAGDKLRLGTTLLEVIEDKPPAEQSEFEYPWQEKLDHALQFVKMTAKKDPNPQAVPFQKPTVLEFIGGIQAGNQYTYGFGPRQIGRLCPDGLLYETGSPDLAFELFPSLKGACELRSQIGHLRLNDKRLDHLKSGSAQFVQVLQNGDRISYGQTVIVVKISELK